MKIFICLFLACIYFSCNNNPKPTANAPTAKDKLAYFDFDEITHYRSSIKDPLAVMGKRNKTSEEIKLIDVLFKRKPESFNDTSFMHDLDRLPFTRGIIQPQYHPQIDAIFSERQKHDSLENACIAVYRDILVFTKKNKTIGLAKICFECEQHYILGSLRNTEGFGKNGDYKRLENILDKHVVQK